MKCLKCGTENRGNRKYCSNCGEILPKNDKKEKVIETVKENIKEEKVESAKVEAKVYEPKERKSFDFIGLLKLIIVILLKPVSGYKVNKEKFDDVETSLIIGGGVTLISTIISLFKTMFNSVFVREYVLFEGYETKVEFGNLLHINYLSVIFKNLFMFAGIIALCALVYFVAGLILKKKTNYVRLIGVTSVGIIPLYLTSLIISPILSIVSTYVGLGVLLIAFVYSVSIIIYTYNQELDLEDDMIVYVNTCCIGILLVAVYIAFVQMLSSALSMF